MSALEQLPGPESLKKLMIVQATLNTILCETEWLRYHSFVQEWDKGVCMAKIDNGAGDHLIILFSAEGSIIKGFDHESLLSPYAQDEHSVWPGIYDNVPNELLPLLEHEGIEKEVVTFCIWRKNSDASWQKGKVKMSEGADDGSDFLIGAIYQTPGEFVQFAKDFFELALPVDVVEKVYEGVPITVEMIQMLNPECAAEEVYRELESLRLV
ncbi:hypothetical protein EDM56_11430 [Brevibacillus fluminis]|uniref:Uncharacterized protein n=1 Tax=Brevibacillus fluminis TaxID=511487 RepID=A0A3M8DQP8_9BACL|nr:hypothetical protein [Brevibacillus fluminis]RNB89771.1 hypothetical protein EDM56_11430 [Brevibacillus fluminis]